MNAEEIRKRIRSMELKLHPVEGSAWGEDIFVKEMSSRLRDEMEQRIFLEGGKGEGLAGWLVCKCVTDGKGERVFQDDDLEWLYTEANGDEVARAYSVIRRHCMLLRETTEAMVKNFMQARSGGRGSASQGNSGRRSSGRKKK